MKKAHIEGRHSGGFKSEDTIKRNKTLKQRLAVSKALRGKPRPNLRGENHPNWKGGVTKLMDKIKVHYKYRQWRSDIFTRDNFTCQECRQRGGNLEAHHLKRISDILQENFIKTIDNAINCEEIWNINNGQTLCRDCHKKTDNFGNKKNVKPVIS